MRRAYFTLAALGLAAALTACGEKKEAAQPAAPEATGGMMEPGTPMMKEGEAPMMKDGQMPMSEGAAPAAQAIAKGEGEVTAIDKTAGTITIKHGPIPEAKWPAMTMAFKANPPALLDTVKVGDRVRFDLKLEGNEVTAIARK
ncbi:copper-binding protein [Caulobacter sp. 17J65-9]|uniref:copper-binding protein n=1 Tax=Caulobacter sp. 17J65-9 TaxID=2709382 RepID=UPI00196A1BE6|nr:copper-binding protein [Caulobacter sp. 17J65-9]